MKTLLPLFISIILCCDSAWAAPRTVFVQLFEWTWEDIAKECEHYLGPNGFSAVQVSPPQEHLITENAFWWERYQPISYKISSRSGREIDFKVMISRCKKAGVDIYVDAVFNHMSGFDKGQGFAGTAFTHYNYENLYDYNDFHHCGRNGDDNIKNYFDRYEVFNCQLLNLADLNTSSIKVQNKIIHYMNQLLDLGVKGFRVDAAKHMDPLDLQNIIYGLKGSPYIIQELIINANEPTNYKEYAAIGDMTVFDFPFSIGQAFKHQQLGALRNISMGLPKSEQSIVFIDNHDLQRLRERSSLLTYQEDPLTFRLAQTFLLTWPYGYPQIFSGFNFNRDHFNQGPPVDQHLVTKPILDQNLNCRAEWTCEHRLPEVANLVRFRNFTDSAFYTSNWWSHEGNQIAFSRGPLGFVVINNSQKPLEQDLQTSLPTGRYCNLTEAINSTHRNCELSYDIDENSRLKLKLGPQSALVLLATDTKIRKK